MEEQKSPSVAPSVATIEDVQRDSRALQNDFSRLTKEMTKYLSTTGRKAVRDVNKQLEDGHSRASARDGRDRNGARACVRCSLRRAASKRGNSPDLVTEAVHGQRPRSSSGDTRTSLPQRYYIPSGRPVPLARGRSPVTNVRNDSL
jgi:hypothetical protein